jgi:ABC-type bacteriocin/lantibiotic exporter with double-glycine peptidase domain
MARVYLEVIKMRQEVISFMKFGELHTLCRYYYEVTLLNKLKLASRYLENRERNQLLKFMFVFLFLGLLDLLGVGAIAALSYVFLKYEPSQAILFLNLSFTRDGLITNLILAGLLILILKNVLGLFFTHRFFRVLALIESRITFLLLRLSINLKPRDFLELSKQSLPRTLTEEVNSFISGIIGFTVLALADSVLLIILLLGIGLLSPLLLASIVVSILVSALVLQKYVAPLALRSGLALSQSRNAASVTVLNLGLASKTFWANSSYGSVLEYFRFQSSKASIANAGTNFSQQLNKYLVEFVMLISIGPSFFVIKIFSPAELVVLTISVLFAVTFRILPLLMRFQGSLITIKSSIGNSNNLSKLLELHSQKTNDEVIGARVDELHFVDEMGDWALRGVKLDYSHTPTEKVFESFNFSIPRNKLTVITGASGVGKTTLMDLILGINSPTGGRIEFNGKKENLHISYMPQEVPIFNLSLIENVALGKFHDEIDTNKVRKILDQVGLQKFLYLTEVGTSFEIEFLGSEYSGGEQQRLGLARCLYSNPNLIILDEPTAALDTVNESNIIDLLKVLSSECTVIVVSHSSALIRSSDHVINL